MKLFIRQMTIGLTVGGLIAAAPAAMAASSHPVQIRPGLITGSSDVGLDANIDILVPLWSGTHSLFFFNPNFRIDDNDGNEQNVGFGFRRMSDCGHFIVGASVYYDSMRSERNNRYQQWGVGAEILSHWFDLRANYYDPFGDTENEISRTGTSASYFFSGNSLMAGGGLQIESEEALKGFDAEVSVLVPGISKYMETRLAGTYYSFDVDGGEDLDGWRGRLEFRPVKAIDLSIEYRDDDVRGRDTFFGGYLELPFSMENLLAGKNPFKGAGDLWSFGKGARPLEERMTDKVVRDRHVVTAATETQTGAPLQAVVDDKMIFVNQDNTAAGDGSYENPYRSLESATADPRFAPGAWVYVFSSDETADTYANAHVALLDDMVFWGQGYQHPVYGLGGGPKPILDGGFFAGGSVLDDAASSVVVLADNSEVMGFSVQNGWNGIYGRNVQGTNIHDNLIRGNNGFAGIFIENRWAPSDVDGKTLSFRFDNNQLLGNAGSGIFYLADINGSGKLENTTIEHLCSNNIAQGNGNMGLYSGTTAYLNEPGSSIADSSFSNTFSGNTVGGSEEGQGNLTSGIFGYITLHTSGDASPISNTTLVSRIENNAVCNNGRDGIEDFFLNVHSDGADSGISAVSLSRYIIGNEIRGNRENGYQNTDTGLWTVGINSPIVGSSINSHFENNIISGNGLLGVIYPGSHIITRGVGSPIARATVDTRFVQNQLNAADSPYDGINIATTCILSEGAGSNLTDISIDSIFAGNRIDGASTADDGIEIRGNTYIAALNPDSPIANAHISNTFTDNRVTNFTGDGIYFPGNYIRTGPFLYYGGDGTGSPISGATINNTLANNIVTDNGGYGIYNWRNEIKSSGATVTNASTNNTYTGNTVDRNGNTGIYLDEDFGGGANTSMNYTFISNSIRDNGGDGLYMYIDPSNTDQILKKVFMEGNTISGNAGDGVNIYINGTDPAKFKGDFGGGPLSSTGGNTFSGNGNYDIYHDGSANMDIWALSNSWTNNADPESTIWDRQDYNWAGDIISSQPQ